jgi:hypothetical protein
MRPIGQNSLFVGVEIVFEGISQDPIDQRLMVSFEIANNGASAARVIATTMAIDFLGNDLSAEQIREHLGREFGMQVRPNHLGFALQRHRRAGRLSERDARWSMAQVV